MPTQPPVPVESANGVPDVAGVSDPEVLLQVLSQVKAGDFTARMPVHWTGVAGKAGD